jgi:hypothetical protein
VQGWDSACIEKGRSPWEGEGGEAAGGREERRWDGGRKEEGSKGRKERRERTEKREFGIPETLLAPKNLGGGGT